MKKSHEILDDVKQHVDWLSGETESLQRLQQCQPGQTGTECSNIPLPSLGTPFIISIPDDKQQNKDRQKGFKEYSKPGLLEDGQLSNIQGVSTDKHGE